MCEFAENEEKLETLEMKKSNLNKLFMITRLIRSSFPHGKR